MKQPTTIEIKFVRAALMGGGHDTSIWLQHNDCGYCDFRRSVDTRPEPEELMERLQVMYNWYMSEYKKNCYKLFGIAYTWYLSKGRTRPVTYASGRAAHYHCMVVIKTAMKQVLANNYKITFE